MHISVEKSKPVVMDVPDGYKVIWFSKYTAWNTSYCVILAPVNNLPKSREEEVTIKGAILLYVDAEAPGNKMQSQKIDRCILRKQGGGFVLAGMTAVEFHPMNSENKGHFSYFNVVEVYESC